MRGVLEGRETQRRMGKTYLRNGALKRRELDHRVRDLPAPKRVEALVEPADAFFSNDLAPSLTQVVGVGRQGGLHAHFDRFEGAEEEVGDELGGGGGAQVDDRLGRVGEEFLAVVVFEDFVGAVLAGALEGVADECWGLERNSLGILLASETRTVFLCSYPSEEDAAETFSAEDGTPCLEVGFVDGGVDLTAAFDEVERCYGGVGGTAGCVEGVLLEDVRFVRLEKDADLPMMPPRVQAPK